MLAGRVIAILDADGNVVVSYMYDAWGAPLWCTGELEETLGKVQPFRYRGYVFDEETGLYYLQSRYYVAELCRFGNADGIILNNLFRYCLNSPVNMTDETGKEEKPHVNLYGHNNLKKELNIPSDDVNRRMTNLEFAWVIRQMDYEKWEYDKKGDDLGMRYRHVDCASVYRYTIKWYYREYSTFVPKGVDSVREIVESCCTPPEAIQSDYSNLSIGMALFTKDGNGNYNHMGYYLGSGKVLESNWITDKKGKTIVFGVHIIDLATSTFTECAYLNGIEYIVDVDEEEFWCHDFQ